MACQARPDQADRRRGRAPSSPSSDRHVRDERPARLAAPDAALVRRAPDGPDGADELWALDVRQVAEDAQPRARPARDAAGRGRRGVPGAARRDARDRGRDPPRRRRRARASGMEIFRRYAAGGDGELADEVDAMVAAQAEKRVALPVRRAPPRELGPPQARWRLLGSSRFCAAINVGGGPQGPDGRSARADRRGRRDRRADVHPERQRRLRPRRRRRTTRCATSSRQRLEAAFGFAMPVILRRADDVGRASSAGNPFPDAEPTRLLVSFLRDDPPAGATGRRSTARRSPPRSSCSPGREIYLHLPATGSAARSSRRR